MTNSRKPSPSPGSSSKGAVSIALKYIIPLILGLSVLLFYMIFFGAPRLINMLNQSLNVSLQ